MDVEQEEGGDTYQSDPNEERGYHPYDSDTEYKNDGYISNNLDTKCKSEDGYNDGGNSKEGFRGGENSQGDY